jgi:hypothetical protein
VRGLRRTRLVIDAQLAGISVTLPTKVDHSCVVDDSSSVIVDETNDGYQLDEASRDGHQSVCNLQSSADICSLLQFAAIICSLLQTSAVI